jgi:DNA repair photolyase
MSIKSGVDHKVPYSLSRWTDLPASKWSWFLDQVHQGWMPAIDQRTSLPAKWSLQPEETLGLIFWTKNPLNLIKAKDLLKRYKVQVHLTLTGWSEVERGAPLMDQGCSLMARAVEAFGAENVIWRFTPVPAVPDVVERFQHIARVAHSVGLRKVFTTFLQENAGLPDQRSHLEKADVLQRIQEASPLEVLLCQDDHSFATSNIKAGVCAPASDWGLTEADRCGCCYTVDPFAINEACAYACSYCYATTAEKRNTTKRRLDVI